MREFYLPVLDSADENIWSYEDWVGGKCKIIQKMEQSLYKELPGKYSVLVVKFRVVVVKSRAVVVAFLVL